MNKDIIDEKLRGDVRITITVDEAAEMLGVGKNLMLNLVKREDFPALQFNRKIIINKEQFMNWFNSLTNTKMHI